MATHASPGEGSVWIEQRGGSLVARGRRTEKGRPTVRASVTVQRGLKGRALERAIEDAKATCRAIMARRLADLDAGTMLPADRERATLSDYAELWLTEAEHSERRASTVAVYRRLLELHVLPVLGPIKLRDFRKEHVVRWWPTVATDALRAQAHAVLVQVLHSAADDDYPVAASVLRVDRPRYDVPDQPHVTPAQMRLLLDASPEPWRTLFLLSWATGARVGEVMGFAWGDLDEVSGALTLAHQLDRAARGRVELKARRQRRRVALGPETLAALKAHRQREQAADRGQPGDYVFCRDTGEPLYYRLVRDAFKAATLKAKLPETLKLHSLRHGAAQAMLDAGVDVDTVSRRLGHADIGTTSASYLRASLSGDLEAARKLERTLVAPTVAPTDEEKGA